MAVALTGFPGMEPPDILSLLGRSDVVGVAVEDTERSVSYSELGPSVRGLAGALAREGVSAGDRVAVMLPNSSASVELYLACALSGAIWVGINPAAPQAERDRQCSLVTPTVVVTSEVVSSTPASGRVVELEELRQRRAEAPYTPPDLTFPCAIGFSSGTTGTPKAIVHNRAAVSLVAAVLAETQLCAGDRVGVILPMSIHNLMAVGALPALFAGATCVAVDRMNAAGVAAACRDRRLSLLNALVPATIYDLVHDDDAIAPGMLSSLRFAGTGAAGLTESLRAAFEAKFGVRLVGTYGMTEAPGVVCSEKPDASHIPGASGTPLPHLAVGTCDDHGRRLTEGQEGELLVSAADSGKWADLYRPAMGRWTENGLVRTTLDEKSFRTGDYGWVDTDGAIHVTARRADVIVRGGVNVNAAEIESLLGQLPGVRDVAVVATPDARLGQRILAFAEPSPGISLDAAELRRQAQSLLSHGKVPDEFVVGGLPRNAMGKVARKELVTPAS
ncbi:class I adenylate-forming enzyme family protein [Mycobacterium sp.]|uniref:class I adenylate-forming enzyme family protein n=1 Tax=Mycobacterium sp. TaxID=1785 RepID=UPI0025CBE9B2|nr:class I adenylate-forming enzyme family protein [Mycobacterium sp.]